MKKILIKLFFLPIFFLLVFLSQANSIFADNKRVEVDLINQRLYAYDGNHTFTALPHRIN